MLEVPVKAGDLVLVTQLDDEDAGYLDGRRLSLGSQVSPAELLDMTGDFMAAKAMQIRKIRGVDSPGAQGLG